MIKFLIFIIVFVIGFIGYNMFSKRTIEHEVFIKHSDGKVVAKYFEAEYTTSSLMLVGKVMIPTTTTHPAKYKIHVVYNGVNKFFEVNQPTYNKFNEGDTISVSIYNVEQFRKNVQFGSYETFNIEG